MTLAAVRAFAARARASRFTRGDRLALAAVPGLIVLVAIPWILAGVGVYTGDVPVLDDIYISKAVAA